MESTEFFTLQDAVAGRYSLVRELGRGGMGVVFLARDVALDRPVAIKLLPPAMAADPEQRRRFLREARIAAGLSHPHIVPVHAVEEVDGLAFIAMAYVDGETLGQRIRRAGALPVREVQRLLREVSWALDHAHARGIIHRDIKPDNILLERESGRALVTDFGIAAGVAGTTPASGTAAGTPAYMSPEQAEGAPADARADLYALGVTAWFALAGRHPFGGENAVALLRHHASTPVPLLQEVAPRVPARLARLVERTMAKDPGERPASAAELAAGLEAIHGAVVPAVPAPLRMFLREADSAVREMGVMATAMTVTGGIAAALRLFSTGLDQTILSSIFILAMVLAAGAGAVRLGQIVEAARALLRQGYDHRALASAAVLARQELLEEHELALAVPGRARREGLGLVAIGALKSAAMVAVVLGSWGPGWFQGMALVGAIVLPTVTLRKFWQIMRPGRGGWLRALAGKMGRALLGVAGIGLGARRAPPDIAAGELTVAAIGQDAQSLFRALPADDQRRLQELQPVIARLAADATRLHEAGDAPGAREKLATVAAALDTIRLDLLRVRAGAVSAMELTEQIAVVSRVHDQIQDHEEAEAQIGRLLRDHTPTPA